MSVIQEPVNTPASWSARAQTFENSWDACGWSLSGQLSRFAAVLSAVQPRPSERLLDFGCGTGDFSEWLPADVSYLGFDTAPGMVARAAREHPDRVFQSWEPGGRFDVTVAIGVFNLPGSKEATWHQLRRLWEMTRRVMAVSLYAGADEQCLIYTEAEVDRHVLGESWRGRVERWRRNDLLVVVER